MRICQVSTGLAYAAAIYISASVFYIVITRSYGTPFSDAVKKYPRLVTIKRLSAEKRKWAFVYGVVFSSILMCMLKPFGDCW